MAADTGPPGREALASSPICIPRTKDTCLPTGPIGTPPLPSQGGPAACPRSGGTSRSHILPPGDNPPFHLRNHESPGPTPAR